MSSILKIKENGQFKSVPALKGEPGKDGTQISFTREYVAGDDVVKIATITCDGVDTALYAPTSGGGGSQVTYTDTCTFVGRIDVGKITINGTEHFVQIPSNVSEFANNAGYITEDDIPTVPTKTSDLTNDSGFVTNNEVNYSINSAKTSVLQSSARLIAEAYSSEESYSVGDYVYYAIPVMGGASTPQICRCKVACSNVLPTNSQYWESVTIANELKSNTLGKYMPGDVIKARVVYGYAATSTSTFSLMLNKPIDASVLTATVTASALKGGGTSVSNPALTATILENTDTAMPRQEVIIKYNSKPASNVAATLIEVVITFV